MYSNAKKKDNYKNIFISQKCRVRWILLDKIQSSSSTFDRVSDELTRERVVPFFVAGVILSIRHEQILVQHTGLSRVVRPPVSSLVVVVQPPARRQQHLFIVFVLQISIGVLCLESRQRNESVKYKIKISRIATQLMIILATDYVIDYPDSWTKKNWRILTFFLFKIFLYTILEIH